MRGSRPIRALQRGVSLVETMVAIGVLAIVAPLALAALMKSGEGGAAARFETRSASIVDACMEELKVARRGGSPHLSPLLPGQNFGQESLVCLAFASDGSLLGRVEGGDYERGVVKISTGDVAYLARMQGVLDTSRTGFPDMLTVTVAVEHPAAAPANKRRRLEFHTKLP